MKNHELLEKIHKIKKSRTKLDVLDFSKEKKITPKIFWNELFTVAELNIEYSKIEQIGEIRRITLYIHLPVIERCTLYVDVYFDDDDSVIELRFDPGTDYQYDFVGMIGDSTKSNKVWNNIDIGLT